MVNARFIELTNNAACGFVKLTVPDGETIWHYYHTTTDEGYSSRLIAWTNADGHVTVEIHDDGRDCDGRMSHHAVYRCPLSQLRSEPAYDAPDVLLPRWQQVSHSQRDYAAEAMNY